MTKEPSRRRRVAYVYNHRLLFLFANQRRVGQYTEVPKPIGLPETARVISSFQDCTRDAIGFVIEDESFDEVPLGAAMPEIKIEWEIVKLTHTPIPAIRNA